MPSQGDIVLIPVPFTDLSSTKRRPVIVVSNDDDNSSVSDMVVVAMTSTPATSPHSFSITSVDLIEGTLNHPGTVRVDKIYTLDQALIVKTFGRVNTQTLTRIQSLLLVLTALRPGIR